MYLMLAVYFVNNFTYNTKIWFLLAAMSILIYFVQKVLYYFNGEIVCVKDYPIKDGEKYTLTKNLFGMFLENDIVKIVRFSENNNTIRICKDAIGSSEFTVSLKDFLNSITNKEATLFKTFKPNKVFLILCIVFSTLHIVIPSKSTAQYMVGAYILEEVVTSEGITIS